MKRLSIDIETYSSINLAKSGVYKYVESEDFEILLFAYAVDDGQTQIVDLAQGEQIPEDIIDALHDTSITKWAFNATFERICLSAYLGVKYLDPMSWRCTMVWSAYLGLPLSLEMVGKVLGLDKQKLSEGKDLIRYFCVPCLATKTNGGRTRNLPTDSPDKWTQFKQYNMRDVDTERAIQQKLAKFPVPEFVWKEYQLDQAINDRGIQVDLDFVREAIEMDGIIRNQLMLDIQQITALENPNSVTQLKSWLEEQGIQTETLDKKSVQELVNTTKGEVAEAMSIRLKLAKSSIKKYQAMVDVAGVDHRCRGMFQFLGANRTGRFSGRNIQLQNLPRNYLSELDSVRAVVRSGDTETMAILYDDVPDVLSQLIRTAFVPREGCWFFVADFSAIEARVIAWLAGETWREELFQKDGDIYCMSASQMFGVPVVKHGVNGELRQKGKIAELACIAEGQLVLTDKGLVPIEKVTTDMKVWDGVNWVTHDGVIDKGEREVITYDGLTATPDHRVWVEGESKPIYFGQSASNGTHLLQTGNGRRAIWMGENNQSREALERKKKSLLRPYSMCRMWKYSMARTVFLNQRKKSWLSAVLSATSNTKVARQKINRSKATMRKSKRQRVQKLWCERNSVQIFKRPRCGKVSTSRIRSSKASFRNRQDKQRWTLRKREYSICRAYQKQSQQTNNRVDGIHSELLALQLSSGHQKTNRRKITRAYYRRCTKCCDREKKIVEINRSKARVYDIRNAGPHHRFTVSGKLVHNCGYGGAVGALKAMGALSMGLQEEELQPLVTAWRESNPNIVALWWDVDKAVKECIKQRITTQTHGILFTYQSGMLRITLPSGRQLTYVKPQIGMNQFGGESVTYEGIGAAKKWERIESYGPKFVENIVQAIARDLLVVAMQRLSEQYDIVAHVHDEVIIEAPSKTSLDEICQLMSQVPSWAEGLILNADGYVCDFYKKD